MKKPSFMQQWVLTKATDTVLYSGSLDRGSCDPFFGEINSKIKSFLNRMVESNWLFPPENGCFYRLTNKAIEWKKSCKKTSSDYHNEYEQKMKSYKSNPLNP